MRCEKGEMHGKWATGLRQTVVGTGRRDGGMAVDSGLGMSGNALDMSKVVAVVVAAVVLCERVWWQWWCVVWW